MDTDIIQEEELQTIVKVHDQEMKNFEFDTYSEASVISVHFIFEYPELVDQLIEMEGSLVLKDNIKLDYMGVVELKIVITTSFVSKIFASKVYVAKSMSTDLIIGWDVMRPSMIIEPQISTIIMNGIDDFNLQLPSTVIQQVVLFNRSISTSDISLDEKGFSLVPVFSNFKGLITLVRRSLSSCHVILDRI